MIVAFVITLALAGIVGGFAMCEWFMVDNFFEMFMADNFFKMLIPFILGYLLFDIVATGVFGLIVLLMEKL